MRSGKMVYRNKKIKFIKHILDKLQWTGKRELMDYIDRNSNLSVEWIDRKHFVEPSMMGFRLVKKTKIEKKQN